MLGGLVGLWIAARIGYRRRLAKWDGNPLKPKPDPFQPGLEEVGAFLLVLGVLSCAFGFAQFISPDYTRDTSSRAWPWNSMYDSYGTLGVATVWFGLGGILIASGITALRR